MKKVLFTLLCVLTLSTQAFGSDLESRIQAMEETLKKQQKTIEEQQKIIGELKDQIKTQIATEKQKPTAVIAESSEPGKQKPAGITGLFGGSAMSNPNISLVLNTYAYSSSLTNDELKNRGIRGYTTEGIDRRNGFNLDSAELAIYAPVDPYFNLYATIPVTENGATVEEAYVVTTSLPKGHQIKAGEFKSGFGRLNSQHSHVWDFVDNPLPYRAFIGFGDEGIDEKGVQYTYLPPLPFYTILGVEVLQGENKTLFGADATGGLMPIRPSPRRLWMWGITQQYSSVPQLSQARQKQVRLWQIQISRGTQLFMVLSLLTSGNPQNFRDSRYKVSISIDPRLVI